MIENNLYFVKTKNLGGFHILAPNLEAAHAIASCVVRNSILYKEVHSVTLQGRIDIPPDKTFLAWINISGTVSAWQHVGDLPLLPAEK